MSVKHWVGAFVLLAMAVGVKSYMIFIRLVVLAAAGLAGLFLLHVLAMDYRKIQASRPKAFGLFKRSIDEPSLALSADVDSIYSQAHRQMENAERIQHVGVNSNSVSLLSIATKMDPQGCARRYICSVAATPDKSRTPLQKAILQIIESHKDAEDFREAAELGRESVSAKQCQASYPACSYSITEMLRLIQPVY